MLLIIDILTFIILFFTSWFLLQLMDYDYRDAELATLIIVLLVVAVTIARGIIFFI